MNTEKTNISWNEILEAAIIEPGLILKAYSNFHNYSIGNQIAAVVQCKLRKIEPSPINTYQGWQSLNRQVKRGEKAIWLCMPLTRKVENDDGDAETVISNFVWKPRWFCLSQTEGEAFEMPEIAGWDKDLALQSLGVRQVEFNGTNGNVQGYAQKRTVAVSPIAALPHKTLFHEIGHIVLGHTIESDFQDDERTPKSLREVEAESVALLLCESLQLDGAEYCRGYIQNWLQGDVIPEKSAQKILGAADRILKAGRCDKES